jgi:hypothetical protein
LRDKNQTVEGGKVDIFWYDLVVSMEGALLAQKIALTIL